MNRKTLCIVIALMVLSLGAILVAVEPELTGDVNRAGIVNILDLVEVASQVGEQGEPANTATNVGQFLNDLNGLPVNVTISLLENTAVETGRVRDLRANLWDYENLKKSPASHQMTEKTQPPRSSERHQTPRRKARAMESFNVSKNCSIRKEADALHLAF